MENFNLNDDGFLFICLCVPHQRQYKLKTQGFVGLAYQGKDIVFRFIIEYSSLKGFGPLGNNK